MPNDRSLTPMRNFQDGFMEPKRLEKVSTQVLYDNYIERRIGYYADPISCSHFYRVKEGPYAGTATEGIEGSGIWDFACTFDIDYAPAIIRAYSVCSQLGLDIDSTSSALGWAFELYQRGIINKGDTDGYALEWGRYDILLEFLRRIAFREGFGDILAEGCMRASQIMGRGSEKYAIQVKGQDLKEPLRSCKGWALGVTVDTRGGGHCAAAPWAEYGDIDPDVSEKIWGVRRASEPTTYDQKEIMVAYYERLNKMLDSLGICIFTSNISGTDLLGPEDYAKMLSAAVGFEVTGREFMQVGERIHNVEKAYNVLHANFGRRDDYPPERMMNEPVKSGPLKGQRLDKNQWDKLLDRYYRLHGWNVETGLQSRECLIKLDLEEVATDLERASRISEGAQ
jgi:aldehyde:ferredoxin oxidoreductase